MRGGGTVDVTVITPALNSSDTISDALCRIRNEHIASNDEPMSAFDSFESHSSGR